MLKEVNLPQNFKGQISSSLFARCKNLKYIQIPDGIDYISAAAFSSCSSLENITIPLGIKGINHSAFGDCSSLTIKIPQPDPSKITLKEGAGSAGNIFKNVVAIKVPQASVAAYKTDASWKTYASIISGY